MLPVSLLKISASWYSLALPVAASRHPWRSPAVLRLHQFGFEVGHALRQVVQAVVQTHGVADGIRAQLHRVNTAAHKIRQIHFVHRKISNLQIKALVLPDGNRLGAVHRHTQQAQQALPASSRLV